jgi:uncharacterized membrane protein
MPDHRTPPARLFAAWAIAFVVIGALDALWLGVLMTDFYRRELGDLMASSVRIGPALGYYLGYPAAIVALALTPRPATLASAALRSGLLGLAAFGVYDLTNLATLRGYSPLMAAVDLAWGTFASAVGGTAAYRWAIGRGA